MDFDRVREFDTTGGFVDICALMVTYMRMENS